MKSFDVVLQSLNICLFILIVPLGWIAPLCTVH
jgi:hypothetical protein